MIIKRFSSLQQVWHIGFYYSWYHQFHFETYSCNISLTDIVKDASKLDFKYHSFWIYCLYIGELSFDIHIVFARDSWSEAGREDIVCFFSTKEIMDNFL